MVIKPPEAPTEGRNSKASKAGGAEIFDILQVKRFPLCFLKANNITTTFHNFISDRIPFVDRINPSNIPAQDFPTFDISDVSH